MRLVVRACFAVVALVFVGLLVLATPPGQRWAIRTIVETAAAQLAVEGQDSPRLALESVGVHLSLIHI